MTVSANVAAAWAVALFTAADREAHMGEIEVITEPTPDDQTRPDLYRIVILALAGVALIALVGGFLLAALGRAAPESAWALGAVAVGALAGMLAPRPA